jgi:hypothetical protein
MATTDYDKERTEPEAEETEVETPSVEVPEQAAPAEPSLVNPEVVKKLQSTLTRYKNIADVLQSEMETKDQLLAQLRTGERKALLAELGDNPTVQQLLKKMEELEMESAKVEAEKKRLLPVRKLADAQELIERYSLAQGSLDELTEAQSFAEMEGMAKVLAKTKTVPQEPKTPKKTPAISHVPDSGVTTAPIKGDFENIEQRYAEGKITLAEYKEARKKKGLF